MNPNPSFTRDEYIRRIFLEFTYNAKLSPKPHLSRIFVMASNTAIVMRLIVVCCLLALSYAADNQTPVILCGRQLANARVLLCYGAEFVNKRSRTMTSLDFLPGDKTNDIDWPWSGRRGALSANWSRYKRVGLADECCLKPCTPDVILAYC